MSGTTSGAYQLMFEVRFMEHSVGRVKSMSLAISPRPQIGLFCIHFLVKLIYVCISFCFLFPQTHCICIFEDLNLNSSSSKTEKGICEPGDVTEASGSFQVPARFLQ